MMILIAIADKDRILFQTAAHTRDKALANVAAWINEDYDSDQVVLWLRASGWNFQIIGCEID